MKIANIILSVLILLCAIASAVFSYFLFEKREQFVDGWSKMASEINQTAVSLDRNSGVKKLADELTVEKLGHKNYSPDFANQLKKLSERANQVVTSRDSLASALLTIGNSVKENINNVPTEQELQGLNTYNVSQEKILEGVAGAIKKRDTQYSRVARLSSSYLGTSINTNELKNGSKAPVDKIENALKAQKSRRQKYESTLTQIANKVGRDRFNSNQPDKTLKAIVNNVEQQRQKLNRTAKELKETTQERNNLKGTLDKKIKYIEKQNIEIAKCKKQINDLKKVLGLAPEDTVAIWTAGSPEARQALAGKVLQVDNQFGHIVIDLGRKTTVVQQIGNNKYEKIDPQIQKGLKLVVVDGDISEIKTKFVSRVKVDVVGDKCSTALIPAGSKEIKVGQRVYWIPEN